MPYERGGVSDDKQAAEKIMEAAKVLNEAVNDGVKRGLAVELRLVDVTAYGDPQRVFMVIASVERREKLA